VDLLQYPVVRMGEVLQSVKIIITLFAIDESRVSITVVGSNYYKGIAIGFCKIWYAVPP